jgi:MSHA biogenesis protein MshO
VTLLEVIVAMVVLAILVAATAFFLSPIRQAVDLTGRAELTDIADNALQRIGREVRLALPNSVRVTGGGSTLEFLAVRTAGRYRADVGSVSTGSDCPSEGGVAVPHADLLSFDAVDTCFKSIGPVLDAATIAGGSDQLVLNNYGPGFTGQNAYENSPLNRVLIQTRTVEASRLRLTLPAGTTFQRALHDSPGKRFFVVSGPVTFQCNTGNGELTRHSGYTIADTPTLPAGVLIANNVASCNFDYDPNGVAPQVGLLTLRLTLRKTLSGGTTETVRLYHGVHVNNVP